jgi:hypothetical protein
VILNAEDPFWEVDIQFNIHGEGLDYFGDGFAFWATQDSGESGPGYFSFIYAFTL